MPLDPGLLRRGLEPIFAPDTMPRGSSREAAGRWLAAYRPYAAGAIAGTLLPTFPMSDAALLASFPGSGFTGGLSSALDAFWSSSVWAGPGFTGTASSTLSLQSIFEGLRNELMNSADPAAGLRRLSDALHTYTLGIVVLSVNVATGITATIPIS